MIAAAYVNGAAAPVSLEDRLSGAQEEGLEANLRRAIQFIGPRGPIELQALGVRDGRYEVSRAAHARTASDAVSLCAAADKWAADGLYFIPAQLQPGVETRHAAPGSWFDMRKGGGTSDNDIAARLVLGVDCDVRRPSKISATDEEMGRSVAVAARVHAYLADAIGLAALALVHSGNGRQVWIALDGIPANEASRLLAASVLVGLHSMFSDETVAIDLKLSDAKRLLPACGTLKKKGAPGIAERPHRRTAIVAPPTVQRLSLDGLRELLARIRQDCGDAGRAAMDEAMGIKAPKPGPTKAPRNAESPFERANALDPTAVADWLGLYDVGELRCPGCGESSGVDVIDHGLKCLHNRCDGKGRHGFRTNVDLVMEVRGVDAVEAVNMAAAHFGFEGVPERRADNDHDEGREYREKVKAAKGPTPAAEPAKLRSLSDLFAPALVRAERRANRLERPIPLPWRGCEEQFGGGLWPGMHVLNAGTGVGKTAASLQIALNAVKADVPVLYIGLELEEMQIALRVLGEEARVPWSQLYLGKAGPALIERAKKAADTLGALPFFVELSRPHGWPTSELVRAAELLRKEHPDTDGSRPCLVVLDFLQLVGPELDESRSSELRERVGRAAYAARDIARRLNMAVLVISSIARDKLRNLANAAGEAGLTWTADDDGRPLRRGMMNPDAIIGIGKESGDIEYAADSVTALFRVPGTWREGEGVDVVMATAKGRATGAGWSPLLFTGFGYVEPEDGGARLVDALTERSKTKSDAKAERERLKEQESRDDAVKVARFVLANPGCSGREAKGKVARNETRWRKVRALLGPSLSAEPLHFDLSRAPGFVRTAIEGGDADA